MIRYRTRDLSRLLPPTARSMRRMGKITGRSDDMLIIRGVNLFPTQIEELVLKVPSLTPYYQLVVTREGHLDRLEVHVEERLVGADETPPDPDAVARELQHHIKAQCRRDRARGRGGPGRHRPLRGQGQAHRRQPSEGLTRRPLHVRPDGQDRPGSGESRDEMSPQERAFQDRIDADIKIEPKDWMPEDYRKTLIRRSRSTRTPRSSACSPRATGSPARPPWSARRSCSPKSRTKPATASTSTAPPRPSAFPATS